MLINAKKMLIKCKKNNYYYFCFPKIATTSVRLLDPNLAFVTLSSPRKILWITKYKV